jgi:hypothetical protein
MPIMVEQDILNFKITDIHSKDLHESASEKLKIRYLSNSDITELKEVKGVISGYYQRLIVSLPVKINQQTKNVHFIVTGSSRTYICEEVFNSFKVTSHKLAYPVLINNKPIAVYLPPKDMDINILGLEYLYLFQTDLHVKFSENCFSISFPEDDASISNLEVGKSGQDEEGVKYQSINKKQEKQISRKSSHLEMESAKLFFV